MRNKFILLLLLLAALKYPRIKIARTHLAITLGIQVQNSQFQSQEVIFQVEVNHVLTKISSHK